MVGHSANAQEGVKKSRQLIRRLGDQGAKPRPFFFFATFAYFVRQPTDEPFFAPWIIPQFPGGWS
jgi:hypothetical protein